MGWFIVQANKSIHCSSSFCFLFHYFTFKLKVVSLWPIGDKHSSFLQELSSIEIGLLKIEVSSLDGLVAGDTSGLWIFWELISPERILDWVKVLLPQTALPFIMESISKTCSSLWTALSFLLAYFETVLHSSRFSRSSGCSSLQLSQSQQEKIMSLHFFSVHDLP